MNLEKKIPSQRHFLYIIQGMDKARLHINMRDLQIYYEKSKKLNWEKAIDSVVQRYVKHVEFIAPNSGIINKKQS